jgi:Uma2 family endonuclease
MQTILKPEPIKLTYTDFCDLPDDGRRYEILDGDLYMSPSPGESHQRTVLNLATLLKSHVERLRLGRVYVAPFDILLSEFNVVEPDLIYVSTPKLSIITDKNIQGAPDLLIEVVSPWSVNRDNVRKRNVYARCGVPFYWLVDPQARTVTELELIGDAYAVLSVVTAQETFKPKLFPDLAITQDQLWA